MLDGILFRYDEDVPGELRNTFETSVGIWCNRTDVAWNISAHDIAIATESGADSINSVVMRPGSAFPSNALAAMVITGHFTTCANSPDVAYYINDVDVIINEDKWNPFEDNWEKKWQNAMLHELGHAHCLNHSKKPFNVQGDQYLMIADQGPFGTTFMPITNWDGIGANTMFNASAILLSIGGTCANIAPIITHPNGNCGGIINATKDINIKEASFKLFPNPLTGDVLGLKFHATSKANVAVRVSNLLGTNILKDKDLPVVEGENILVFDAGLIKEKGLYLVTLTNGLQSITLKMIKL